MEALGAVPELGLSEDSDYFWRTAIHEAGHVVAYEHFGRRWNFARIADPNGAEGYNGLVDPEEMDERAAFDLIFDDQRRVAVFFETATICAAGYVAGRILTGGQFEEEPEVAVANFGAGPGAGPDALAASNAFMCTLLPAPQQIGWLLLALRTAERILREHWGWLMTIAGLLVVRREITPADIYELGIQFPGSRA